MSTRKVSEREKLTVFARTASDEQLDEAFEIFSIERRVRAANKKPVTQTRTRTAKKDVPPGPPNPPKPAGDNPQG